MKKFTFKKVIRTGRYRSFDLDQTDIKLGGKEVGHISQQRDNYGFKISFAIKKLISEKDPAPFKWIGFKKLFNSEKDARNWVKIHNDDIQKTYKLYQFED